MGPPLRGLREGQRALPKRLSRRIGGIEAEYRIFGTMATNPGLAGCGRAHGALPYGHFLTCPFYGVQFSLTFHSSLFT